MDNKYTPNLSEQFKDKIIIVTGSTQGSGAETAKLLAGRGAKGIAICGRNEQKGNKIKDEIKKIGSECIYIKADLENLSDCKRIVAETDKKFKTVDSFINVAAFTERGTILSTTEENYDKNFNINVKAPLFMMQDVIKIMIRDKKKGTIAHVLSMAAYSGMPFLTAYSSSKAALAIMIKNVANSVSGHQIRINGVNLGWTDTPAETVIQKKFHNADDDWLKKKEAEVPFKRLNKPLDVARILAFLCSDESGIMTGSIVDFDQTVAGWHSYSAYETKILDNSILGE
ncbi:MAG: SDR family oxidoreductase [Bacteroidetes bacterium]|jgi:NAD(P)-dependent dehydrogenase (short-subunit alcohol dehydrogenase family)|nr:SDR family oxidoreductase [Bacteroidota bacterium]MDA1197901.1 SDR family oxidoreductase [Pseudomonadota bacterium]